MCSHLMCPSTCPPLGLATAEAAVSVADINERMLQHAHAFVKGQRERHGLAYGPSPGGEASLEAGLVAGKKVP